MSSPLIAVRLGEPWPQGLFTVPSDAPSFGWHYSGRSPFLVLGDPFGDVSGDVAASARLRLGFAKFGPLVIMAVKSPDLPFTAVESPRPYLLDDELPPEVTVEAGDHILWQMTTVSRGVVVNMRAFTTSPAVTRFLRRAFAEQRAEGPISYDESDEWIWRWQQQCPDERAVWRRVEVTCRAGD